MANGLPNCKGLHSILARWAMMEGLCNAGADLRSSCAGLDTNCPHEGQSMLTFRGGVQASFLKIEDMGICNMMGQALGSVRGLHVV